jgi:hypothetical protein
LAYDEVERRGRAPSNEADLWKSSILSLINEGIYPALVETNVRWHFLCEKAGTATTQILELDRTVRQANQRLNFANFNFGWFVR